MNDQPGVVPSVTLNCSESNLIRLATVLQSGFIKAGTEGDSIYSFLLSLPGFTEDYLLREVQTIFYNGDALDDLDSALAGSFATIALGSAMPGLAGAIMKKGSVCGAFRKTRTVQNVSRQGDPVQVRVKLFNTIARDRGPRLFNTGLRLDTHDLILFLELRPRLMDAFSDIIFDNMQIAPEILIESLSSVAQIRLEVRG